MKKTYFKCSFTAILLLLVVNIYSQGNNTVAESPVLAASFLNFTPDARALSLGGTGVARVNDLYAQYHNASKYPFAEYKSNLSVGYLPWMEGITNDMFIGSVVWSHQLNRQQSISSSFRYFNMGGVELRDEHNVSTGSVNPKEYAFDVAYARAFSPNWSMAMTLRYIVSDFTAPVSGSMEKGEAFAMDLSSFYTKELHWKQKANIHFGVNISNLGQKMKYRALGEEYLLPARLSLASTLDYNINRFHKLAFSLDASKPLTPSTKGWEDKTSITAAFNSFSDASFSEEVKEITLGAGVEYSYLNHFQSRFGYHYQNKDVGYLRYCALGQSIQFDKIIIDAAYMIPLASNFPLKYSFSFSLSYWWK